MSNEGSLMQGHFELAQSIMIKNVQNFCFKFCKQGSAVTSHYTKFFSKTKRRKNLETIWKRTKGEVGF